MLAHVLTLETVDVTLSLIYESFGSIVAVCSMHSLRVFL
jgi:hypothetical protein